MRGAARRRCRRRSAPRHRRRRAASRARRRSAKASVTAGLKCAPEIGPKHRDQDDEDGAGRQRVAEQRERDVSAGQLLGHDAGADDGREQESGAERFGCERAAAGACGIGLSLAPGGRSSTRPISSQLAACSVSRSSAGDRQAGEDRDAVVQHAGRHRRRRARSRPAMPSTAAGSGTPQCAVIGWPGQTGQASPAALSQTVKTKSICGAPGRANSSQLFERKPRGRS